MKVTLQHLTKKFPNRNKKAGGDVVAVNDFTFEIPDGKLIGLLGPSGCGKSTALNLISGLLEPTAGQIFFGEDDVTHLPPENRGVGLVFQNYALYPHLTVRQNIMFPLENLRGADKLTKAEMAERTLAAAKLVQLEGSRCPIWTRGCASRPGRRSAASSGRPASLPCLSPTIRRRP